MQRGISGRVSAIVLAIVGVGSVACSAAREQGEGPTGERASRVTAAFPKARVVTVDVKGDGLPHRTGHQVVAVHDDLYVARGVADDIATQTNTFYRDLYRFQPKHHDRGKFHELPERGAATPPAMAVACMVGDESGTGSLLSFGGAHYLFELDPGFFASLVVYDTLWEYRIATGRWSAVTPGSGPRPAARAGCNAEIHDGAMYMFGGLNRFLQLNNELWRFDLGSRTWTQLPPNGPVPPPRFIGATAVDHETGKIYLYNGHKETAAGFETIGDFWVYDVASNAWRQIETSPSPPRDEGTLSLLHDPSGKKYLVYTAGHTETDVRCVGFPEMNTATNEIWGFDIEAEIWKKLDVVGEAPRLEFCRGATVGDTHYVMGGWTDVPDPDLVCKQVWNENVYEVSLVAP